MSHKREFFVVLMLSIGMSVVANQEIVRSFLAGGVSLAFLSEIEDWIKLDSISQWCNVSKEDIRSTVGASVVLAVLSCLANQDIKSSMRQCAFRIPFFVSLHSLISSKRLKNLLAKVPLIGTSLGACSDSTCKGECNSCKVRTTLLSVGLWQSVVRELVEGIERKLGIGSPKIHIVDDLDLGFHQ